MFLGVIGPDGKKVPPIWVEGGIKLNLVAYQQFLTQKLNDPGLGSIMHQAHRSVKKKATGIHQQQRTELFVPSRVGLSAQQSMPTPILRFATTILQYQGPRGKKALDLH